MSIFKTNKFFRVIKHFILALPLMFVLGTSLYAIVNPNAKDSYYGETINDINYSELDTISDFQVGSQYFFGGSTFSDTNAIASSLTKVTCSTLIYNNVEYENVNFAFYKPLSNTIGYWYLSYVNGTSIFSDVVATNITFTFTYLANNFTESQYELFNNKFALITFNDYSFLNNAFEFGMYQFTKIGFGQFDFIGTFNGIFTINLNNVYASFINDYINYYLFVEIVYFAPWVFHAFIHFAYDLGDYFTSSFKRNRKDDD